MLNLKIINQNALFQNTFVFTHGGMQFIIDPGLNKNLIEKQVDLTKPTTILLTHYHFDHVLATDYLSHKYNIKVYINKNDKEWFLNDDAYRPELAPYLNGIEVDPKTGFHKNSDDNVIFFDKKIDGFPFLEILETPGHTSGSVAYKIGNELFIGDTILHKSVGRVDLPGASSEELNKTLEMFSKLPDDYVINPGHGRSSTLKELKMINPYIAS